MASSSQQNCSVIDATFGPYAGSCRGGLDFTLLFEEIILCILPLFVAIVASTVRLMFLSKEGIKVIQSPLLPLKLAAYVVLAGAQLALLILWADPAASRTKATTTAVSLSLIGALVFCGLSYSEHRRSVKPSTLLSGYLLFSTLFDVSRTRTLWLRGYDLPLVIVFTGATAIKFFILVLETVEKRSILRPGYCQYPPEATSGIINRSFFWWLNPLLLTGFFKNLAVNDLFTLDEQLVSENLQDSLQSDWHEVTNKSPHSLFFATLSSLKWSLLSAIVPRLCLTGFNFCQPFLINAAITVSQQAITKQTTNAGYGLIGAYILVYTGIAISTGRFQHMTYRTITMMRGALIAMLYTKTSSLSVSAVDPSASVVLMSADIERITTGWQTIHEMWANVIEIGIAIFLLYRQLGVACAIPVAVAIFSMMGSIMASGLVMSRQALWLEAIERRIAATSAMLGAMKGIKMCGLTDILFKTLQDLRVNELRISKKFRKILVWNMTFSFSTPVAAPILTFTLFSILAKRRGNGETLDTARVFTSLSLFTLLSEPLGSLIMALANFMGSVGSFHRIQEFLDTDVRMDERKLSDTIESPSKEYPSFQKTTASSTTNESMTPRSQLTLQVDTPPDYSSTTSHSLVVRDGSFGWDKEKVPILHSISFTVPRGKFTMLVGPVGCGKSTLIKALLGETINMGGTIQVSSPEVAFCDQTAWHMNGSVQKSITGISPMDEMWYKSVIQACALEEDLKQLPRGDRTLIGSSGIALSGGQSQRIALARAVYAKKDVLILDDVLSGLDAETENRVFYNLLGPNGLLRKHNSTVFIASSAATRLPYSDHIIVLGGEGKILEQGNFMELSASGGYVSTFNLPPPDWKYDSDEIVPSIDTPGHYNENVEKCEESKVATDDDTEDHEDDPSRRMGDTTVYLYYINAVGWLPTLIFVVAICGFVVCFSLPAIWVKWWAAANAIAPNQHLSFYLGIYGLIGALALICLIVSGWQMIITMVPRSGENFHWILLKTVLSSPMSFFSSTDTGVTLNRFSQDLQLIDMDLPLAALNTFATFVLCIAQVVIIGVSSTYAAIAFPIILAVLYFIQKFYLRTSRQLRFLDLEAKSPLYSQFLECLSGLVTIRAFGWGKALEQKNLKLLDQSQRPFYQLFAVQRWLTLVLDLVVAAIAVLLIVLVVTLRGTLSVGFVGVALLNVILFSQSIKLLLTFWTNLETHIGSIARIKTFTTGAVAEDGRSENQMPPPEWPARGSIEFKSVSAAYKPSELVLKDISLSIEAGQKIGICGRTGSGKSSLVLTLFRMIELNSGTITIDGIDISTIPRQELRSRLNGVPQDAYFLSGNVRLNADPRNSVSDAAIIDALKSVHLWDVITENGDLDTDIEKIFLSHGQKQLFCLARAMLRKSTILVLDEATSSVDSKTEELMQQVIREKFFSHTIIAVAHKLDTILDFDKVVLMDRGSVVEFECPYTLLSQPSSAFHKLYYSAQEQALEQELEQDDFDTEEGSALLDA